MADNREGFIESMVDKGKTREQSEAFLDILGSAFRRRGWVEGEPLSQDEIGERVDTFMGDKPARESRDD